MRALKLTPLVVIAVMGVSCKGAPPPDSAQPKHALYVEVGDGDGDGSAAKPFHAIQAAVSVATPGTIIYIMPGNYRENIRLSKERSGTPADPIWLVAKNGPGTVHITAVTRDKPVIAGFGVDNYIIKYLDLSGGYNGIQFNQSGRDFSDLVNNIVIEGNTITDVVQDGIKVGQADRVSVVGNVIKGTDREEGIDFVAVTNAEIRANDVSNIASKAAGIFAKGGSSHVAIRDNYVHDVAADGISVGGNTDETSFKPGYKGFEAKGIVVTGNKVERVGKQPLSIRGASDVQVMGNYLAANPSKGVGVYVTRGNPKATKLAYSSNVSISKNSVSGVRTLLRIDPGNDSSIKAVQNLPGPWSHPVGTAAWSRKALPALASNP